MEKIKLNNPYKLIEFNTLKDKTPVHSKVLNTDLVVIRFLGDKEGDDIIDDLLATDAAALSRRVCPGRGFILRALPGVRPKAARSMRTFFTIDSEIPSLSFDRQPCYYSNTDVNVATSGLCAWSRNSLWAGSTHDPNFLLPDVLLPDVLLIVFPVTDV